MEVRSIGISRHAAPLRLRERLAFPLGWRKPAQPSCELALTLELKVLIGEL